MSQTGRTQKQVAAKYLRNLFYFRRPHGWQSFRFWSVFFLFWAGIAALVWFLMHGPREFYNPGPLSATHRNLTSDCDSCHSGANGKLVVEKISPWLTTAAHDLSSAKLPTFRETHGFFDDLKVAGNCEKCHLDQAWHQPGSFVVAAASLGRNVHVVASGDCMNCHKEHRGGGKISMGDTASCLACHSDVSKMADRITSTKVTEENEIKVAVNQKFANGTTYFLPPERADKNPAPMLSFASGHPPFEYEATGLHDPNTLHFNHRRHFAEDIPKVAGKKIDCTSCHQLAAGGDFYAPVTFENNCKICHSLNFDPDYGEMTLPHGSPENVRTYLRNLPFQYSNLAKRLGYTEPSSRKKFVDAQLRKLKTRVQSGENFERQIFYTANPYRSQNPAGERALFTGCAYCHEITPPTDDRETAPTIAPSVAADRWLARGKFTHVPHQHMVCTDCHQAEKSNATADIIMPPKESCAQCHRAPDSALVAAATPIDPLNADTQRAHGGVTDACSSCHQFHPDAGTLEQAKSYPALEKLLSRLGQTQEN